MEIQNQQQSLAEPIQNFEVARKQKTSECNATLICDIRSNETTIVLL